MLKELTPYIYPLILVSGIMLGGVVAYGYIGKQKQTWKDDTIDNLTKAYNSAKTRMDELEDRLNDVEKYNEKLKNANEVIMKSINEKPFEELKGVIEYSFKAFNKRLDDIENKIK